MDSRTSSSRRHFMRLLAAGAAAPFLSSCGSDERSPLVENPLFASAIDLAGTIRAGEISPTDEIAGVVRQAAAAAGCRTGIHLNMAL